MLTDRTSDEQVGVIIFDASGMLGYHSMKKGLHVFALKPIEQFLKQNGFDQPLYVKHADKLDSQQQLPTETLQQEAATCADQINHANPPRVVGGHTLTAQVVTVTPT